MSTHEFVGRDDFPVPQNTFFKGDLPELSDEKRENSLGYFREFCRSWIAGFEEVDEDGEPVEQPNRVELMTNLASSRYAYSILILCYEIQALQLLVKQALDDMELDIEYIDRVAAHMVAVSHAGLPDLAGTYDYSARWRDSV